MAAKDMAFRDAWKRHYRNEARKEDKLQKQLTRHDTVVDRASKVLRQPVVNASPDVRDGAAAVPPYGARLRRFGNV